MVAYCNFIHTKCQFHENRTKVPIPCILGKRKKNVYKIKKRKKSKNLMCCCCVQIHCEEQCVSCNTQTFPSVPTELHDSFCISSARKFNYAFHSCAP